MKTEREQFDEWLGTETCEVHCDESANKNAWYGWQAGRAGLRALVGELAPYAAHKRYCMAYNTLLANPACDCGLDEMKRRAEEARKP